MCEPIQGGWRVITFLVAREAVKADELIARTRVDVGTLAAALGASKTLVIPAVVTGAIEHAITAAGSQESGESSFDVAAEVVLDELPDKSVLSQRLAVFAAGLADIVSSEHSVAYVGRDVIFDPRRGPLKFMFTLKRQPSVGHDEALQGWQTQVGPNLASHPTRVGYIEQQGDLALTQAAIAATGYDGGEYTAVAFEWFRSPQDTLAAYDWASRKRAWPLRPIRRRAVASSRCCRAISI